jgi:hypothetical protein
MNLLHNLRKRLNATAQRGGEYLALCEIDQFFSAQTALRKASAMLIEQGDY